MSLPRMSDDLKPDYFLLRPNGAMVPLIPLDEIPATVQIGNVKPLLSPEDIQSMKCVGNAEPRRRQYIVKIPIIKPSATRDRPPHTSRVAESPHVIAETRYQATENANHSENDRNSQQFERLYGAQSSHEASNRHQSVVRQRHIFKTGIRRANHHQYLSRPNRLTVPNHSSDELSQLPHRQDLRSPQTSRRFKEYCSFWLRTGECDYSQQGCLYKHEMPLDLSTLDRLGLRDIPLWYRQQHGLESLMSSNNNNNNRDNSNSHGKSISGSASLSPSTSNPSNPRWREDSRLQIHQAETVKGPSSTQNAIGPLLLTPPSPPVTLLKTPSPAKTQQQQQQGPISDFSSRHYPPLQPLANSHPQPRLETSAAMAATKATTTKPSSTPIAYSASGPDKQQQLLSPQTPTSIHTMSLDHAVATLDTYEADTPRTALTPNPLLSDTSTIATTTTGTCTLSRTSASNLDQLLDEAYPALVPIAAASCSSTASSTPIAAVDRKSEKERRSVPSPPLSTAPSYSYSSSTSPSPSPSSPSSPLVLTQTALAASTSNIVHIARSGRKKKNKKKESGARRGKELEEEQEQDKDKEIGRGGYCDLGGWGCG